MSEIIDFRFVRFESLLIKFAEQTNTYNYGTLLSSKYKHNYRILKLVTKLSNKYKSKLSDYHLKLVTKLKILMSSKINLNPIDYTVLSILIQWKIVYNMFIFIIINVQKKSIGKILSTYHYPLGKLLSCVNTASNLDPICCNPLLPNILSGSSVM